MGVGLPVLVRVHTAVARMGLREGAHVPFLGRRCCVWGSPRFVCRVCRVCVVWLPAAADCTVSLWDPHAGRFERRLEGHSQGVSDVTWSPDSKYVSTASDDMTIKIWDVATVSVC